MRPRLISRGAIVRERWQRLSTREQWMLLAMSLCVSGGLVYACGWQPMVQRLARVEHEYLRQVVLTTQLQRTPLRNAGAKVSSRPLSLRVSESAAAVKLEIQQMDAESSVLRITLRGDASTLLQWLDRLERDGEDLQSLTLEKSGNLLEAHLTVRS